MKRKINKRLIGTAALAIAMTLLLTVAVCYSMFKNQILDDLRVYVKASAFLFEENEIRQWEEFEKELHADNIRLTFVNSDGKVLYDSDALAAEMENHSDRPEITQAIRTGEGSKIRHSETLDRNTYYYAIRLEGGSVLRASRDAGSIYRIMEYALPYLLAMAVILLAGCSIMSYFMAEGIMRPVKLIAEDIENVEQIETYEEMKPFIDAIKNQHEDVLQNARIRQEFTANVSHELKTPLTAISGYSELIENGMVAEQSEIKRFAGEIHSNANRLLSLINDVIRLSELDGQETEEALVPVNLWESANTCVNMLQINAEKHNVSLTILGENAVILANKQMVEEVLYNLCDNAIRYNKENGQVIVSVRDRLNTAVLTVKDTGIGIPKEHQERIFERFYRVDKSRSKSTGGTGLGLAIVKHILIKLNATISLESEVGEGTEITVTFPAARSERFS